MNIHNLIKLWVGQNTKYALLIFLENVEIYALLGRTKWTQNLGRRTKSDFKDRALGVEYDIGSGLEMLIDEGKQKVADKNLAEADVEELDVVQKVCVSDESSASTEPYDEDAVKKVRTREAMGIINIKEKRQIPSI